MIKCIETGIVIPNSEKIFGLSCPATNAVFTICASCLSKIPEAAKRKGPGMTSSPGELGIDIYEAEGHSPNSEGGYDSFGSGKFLFSLAEKDAKKYLPGSFKKLPKPAQKRAA